MSKSQKPRTPEWFPKMKVRGRKRRMLAPYQRTARAFRIVGGQAQMTAGQIAMMKFMFKGHAVLSVNQVRRGLGLEQ